eukprot:9204351-Karenia_brevis.AAC.1
MEYLILLGFNRVHVVSARYMVLCYTPLLGSAYLMKNMTLSLFLRPRRKKNSLTLEWLRKLLMSVLWVWRIAA